MAPRSMGGQAARHPPHVGFESLFACAGGALALAPGETCRAATPGAAVRYPFSVAETSRGCRILSVAIRHPPCGADRSPRTGRKNAFLSRAARSAAVPQPRALVPGLQ